MLRVEASFAVEPCLEMKARIHRLPNDVSACLLNLTLACKTSTGLHVNCMQAAGCSFELGHFLSASAQASLDHVPCSASRSISIVCRQREDGNLQEAASSEIVLSPGFEALPAAHQFVPEGSRAHPVLHLFWSAQDKVANTIRGVSFIALEDLMEVTRQLHVTLLHPSCVQHDFGTAPYAH